jgi:hypothetical protein
MSHLAQDLLDLGILVHGIPPEFGAGNPGDLHHGTSVEAT